MPSFAPRCFRHAALSALSALSVMGCALLCAGNAWSADMGKTLRVMYRTAETGFDPAQVTDIYSLDTVRAITEPLLTYDYLARPAKLVPNVVEAMPEVRDNAREFVFKIKPGIFFTPDPAFGGKPRELVAQDFVYSIKRILDPGLRSPNINMFDRKFVGAQAVLDKARRTGKFDYDMPIEGLTAPDRYTLRMRLVDSDHKMLYYLAQVQASAVAREVVEAAGPDIMGRPVGTGPYFLKSWVRGSKIVLEANPGFRKKVYQLQPGADPGDKEIVAAMAGKTLPQIGRIEISVVEEAQSRWLAFSGQNADLMLVPPEMSAKAVREGALAPELAQRGIRRQAHVGDNTHYSYFNMDDPVVGGITPEKIALRRAIILGYNIHEDIQLVYTGQAVAAQSPLSPGVTGYDPALRGFAPYDPALARALLDRYGYKDRDGDGYRELPNGKPLVITKGSAPVTQDQLIDELWRKHMDAIGIRMVFEKQKWPDLLKAARLGKLQFWNVGWQAQHPDGDTYLALVYGGNKVDGNNMSRFDLPAFNQRYEKARAMPAGPERDVLYKEMGMLVAGYGVWHMGVHRIENQLMQPWLVGYKEHPFLHNGWMYLDIDQKKLRELGKRR